MVFLVFIRFAWHLSFLFGKVHVALWTIAFGLRSPSVGRLDITSLTVLYIGNAMRGNPLDALYDIIFQQMRTDAQNVSH